VVYWGRRAFLPSSPPSIHHHSSPTTNINARVALDSNADEVAAASFPREFDDNEHNGHGAETRRERIRLPRVVVSNTTTTTLYYKRWIIIIFNLSYSNIYLHDEPTYTTIDDVLHRAKSQQMRQWCASFSPR